jgi:hypothetical protein
MENLKIILNYVSLTDDFYFDIKYNNKEIGQIELMNYPDSYTISIKAYTSFLISCKGKMDDAINSLFEQLCDYIEANMFTLFEDKQFLLLEDEIIANRYAITHNLRKVPRYCGFYLWPC